MATETVDLAAEKAAALAANDKLTAKLSKIEAAEMAVLDRYPVDHEGEMSAEDIATLERTDQDWTRWAKMRAHNAARVDRIDAAQDAADQAADGSHPEEEMADNTPLGARPKGSDGASLADLERALVAQGPTKGPLVSLTLPPMRFAGQRPQEHRMPDGQMIESVSQSRAIGFGPDCDLDLSGAGIPGIERLAISTQTPGIELPEATMEIIDAMWDESRIWDYVRVITTPTGNKIRPSVRTLLTGGATTTAPWGGPNYEGEGHDIRDSVDPTYVGRELNSFKIADIHYESYELLRDHMPSDIRSNVAAAALKWAGLSMGHEIAVGSGSGAPTGIVTELAKAVHDPGTTNPRRQTVPKATAAGDGVMVGDRGPRISDLQNGIHQIPDGYTQNLAIFTSWKNGAHFRRLRIPEGARWYMERDTSGRTLGTIEGNIPVVCSPGFPTLARDSKASVVFGCWDMYLARMLETRLDYSWEVRFRQDQLAIRVIAEFDGVTLDPNAFWAWDAEDVA